MIGNKDKLEKDKGDKVSKEEWHFLSLQKPTISSLTSVLKHSKTFTFLKVLCKENGFINCNFLSMIKNKTINTWLVIKDFKKPILEKYLTLIFKCIF